jgi:multiple sugar transport system substrate-binding protein
MKRVGLGLAVAMCLAVAACGDSDDDDGGSAASDGTAVSGAKVIDPDSMNAPPKGTITYCAGKDTSGAQGEVIAQFNAKYGASGYKVEQLEFATSGDEQRAQFVQRQEAKSDECDVFSSDVIWTAEFASQKWLYDLTPYVSEQRSRFIAAPLETVHYGDRYWGVPFESAAALLYYRDDQVKSPPATWQAVYQEAKANDGIVYQGAPYEGLTCDFLELSFAAGGKVLSDDGTKSEINSPENVEALQFMVDGVKDGTAANGVTTYMEEESRRYWESGRATFMRNWPYAYTLGNAKGSKVKGKFEVMPFPTFEGGGTAAILGGHNIVISVYSKNPGLSLKFADFYASPKWQKTQVIKYAITGTIPEAYDDPEVEKAIPYASELKQAVTQAKARPVSPVYPQISQAIYKNVNAALSGKVSPADAMKTADDQINEALATF